MSIEVTPLAEATERPRRIAIGTFDGVHVGHRQVIRGADTVVTFEPHPLSVVRPEAAPRLLMSLDLKRDVIEGLGVRELIVIPFDEDFRSRSATQFRDEILGDRLGAIEVAVGENFRFGKGAEGDPRMLAERFPTRIEPLVEIGGEVVSSTRVRDLVAAGEVRQAMSCLGAPFLFDGTVVRGDQRGRTLGYPTANLVPSEDFAVPGHGIYAAFANGHPAAVSIGVRPTFDTGGEPLVEAYLIDRDEDLYGQGLRLAFLERLRGEERFDSAEELTRQMDADVAAARDLCASFFAPPERSRPVNGAGTS